MTSTQYHTSDNRVHSSFEAARAHCIANPGVAMCRTPAAQRFARKPKPTFDGPREMSDEALDNRDREFAPSAKRQATTHSDAESLVIRALTEEVQALKARVEALEAKRTRKPAAKS